MLTTPCIDCRNLRGDSDSWKCGAIEARLPDDIVNGVDVEGLPPCPYFSRLTPIKEKLTRARVPAELRVQRPARQGAPRHYRIPLIRLTAKQTESEIEEIIKDYHLRRGWWPTQRQIYVKSRMLSYGDVWNILNRMVENGTLEKKPPKHGLRPCVYAIVSRNVHVVNSPEAINA